MAATRLFADSPLPRYVQLADLFRQRISRGVWGAGEQLPPLHELMREFDVARVTVRQAVEVLEGEGLLSAQRGRGTFVTGQPQRTRQLHLQTSLSALADVYRGDRPKLTLIEEAASVPALEEGEGRLAPRYHFMRRVHSRDGEAYCVISIHLDERIYKKAARRFHRETIIPVLLDMKVPIASGHQSLEIATADVEVASLLEIPVNAPVAEVRRVCRDPEGTVVYVAEITYRGDYVRLDMELAP